MSGLLQHNFLYSCEEGRKRGNEQFVPEHALGCIISGETHFHTNDGLQVFGSGMIGLIRKNQLVKTMKVPAEDGRPFKSINIFLDRESLQRYAAEQRIATQNRYNGPSLVQLTDDRFIRSYFDSLLPYFDQPDQLTPALAALKTREAIELLLRNRPALQAFLFDFNEPHKIDLEAFMNQNFTYNVPLSQFARLTGRSLATFKRDFKKIFTETPEKWLSARRLERAHFLISQKKISPANAYLEAGFENLSHFSYAFKKFYGYNPSRLK